MIAILPKVSFEMLERVKSEYAVVNCLMPQGLKTL